MGFHNNRPPQLPPPSRPPPSARREADHSSMRAQMAKLIPAHWHDRPTWLDDRAEWIAACEEVAALCGETIDWHPKPRPLRPVVLPG